MAENKKAKKAGKKAEKPGGKEVAKAKEVKPKEKKKAGGKVEKKAEPGKKPIAKKVAAKAYEILRYPLITEKAINMIETENKLVFIVDEKSKKDSVKKAVEDLFGVEVDSVNIMKDMKNRKRAFVKINKKYKADDIATRLGVL